MLPSSMRPGMRRQVAVDHDDGVCERIDLAPGARVKAAYDDKKAALAGARLSDRLNGTIEEGQVA